MQLETVSRIKGGYARRADALAVNAQRLQGQVRSPVIADARLYQVSRIAAYGAQAAASALDGYDGSKLLGRKAGVVTVARDGATGLVSLLVGLEGENDGRAFGLCQESGFRGIKVRGLTGDGKGFTPHDLGAAGMVLEAPMQALANDLMRPGESVHLAFDEPAFA